MRMRHLTRQGLVVFVTLLALVGFAPAALARPTDSTGSLAVLLVERETSTPIVGAAVMVFDEAAETVIVEGHTNGVGGVVFPELAVGRYKVFLQVDGLDMWAEGADDADRATVYQISNGRQTTITTTPLPHALITAKLTTAHRTVSRPMVTAEPVGDFGYLLTQGLDTTNNTATLRVTPGSYRLAVNAGSAVQWFPGKASRAGARQFDLSAGDSLTLTEALLPSGRVRGHIIDADGAPVQGATVRLHQGATIVNTIVTSASGTYTMERVLPGKYQVSIDPKRGSVQWMPKVSHPEDATPITVAVDEETVADDQLLPSGSIQGVLTDAAGAPMPRQVVSVSPRTDLGLAEHAVVTTDDTGRYQFRNLNVGDYTLRFDTNTGRRQYAHGKFTAATADPVTVAAGQDTVVNEQLAKGQQVTLGVVDPINGLPVRNFCASMVGPDAERQSSQDSDPPYVRGCTNTDTLVLNGVAPGRYLATLRLSRPNRPYLPSVLRVDVAANAPTQAVAPLRLGGTVEAIVTAVDDGQPVDGVDLYAVPTEADNAEARPFRTSRDGRAHSEPLPVGTYRVFAEPHDARLGRQWVGRDGGTGQPGEAAVVTVRAGASVGAPAVRLDRAGIVHGLVTAADTGKPMPAAISWRAGVPNTDAEQTISTDARGRYSIGGFGPYQWPLLVTNQVYARQWAGGVSDPERAMTVAVEPDTAVALDIALVPGVRVGGAVRSPDWSTTQLAAFSGTTGAPLGSATPDELTHRFDLRVLSGESIKMRYTVETANEQWSGWYDRATDFGRATAVDAADGATIDVNVTQGRRRRR